MNWSLKVKIVGSPVINGKEPNHEGHKVHKGGKGD